MIKKTRLARWLATRMLIRGAAQASEEGLYDSETPIGACPRLTELDFLG